MIGRLTGKVTQEDDGGVVVDVNGVGYEVVVPIGTIGRATLDAEGRASFFVHTHVREDALQLFGFATEGDRLAFRTLIGISSIGPKSAIGILSALPAHELGQAIARKEIGKLTAISGVGKKTAERLLLELKDKLPLLVDASRPVTRSPEKTGSKSSSSSDVLTSALITMGYRQAEANRAVEQLSRDGKLAELALPELIKEALAVLAK